MKILKIVIPIILFFVIISITISENNYVSASNVPTSSVIKVSVKSPVDSTLLSGALVNVWGPSNYCCGYTNQSGMFGCISNSNGNVTVCVTYGGKFQTKTLYCWDYSCFFEMFPNNTGGSCFSCDQQHPIKP